MSVLVTNGRNRIAYGVVRSLGEKGVPVYAADFVRQAMSFSSRYTRQSFVYPSPFRDPAGFVTTLLEHIDRLRPDVLIPVYEETFLIAKHKAEFESRVGLAVPDYEQILVAHNKDRWGIEARECGVPVPATHAVEDLQSGSVSLSRLRYPVLIKPKQGGGAWGIHQADSPEALEALLANPTLGEYPWQRFFVQEKIAGHTHCVAMLFNRGTLKAKVGYRQLRDYPATGGQATARVSVTHAAAERYLETLLKRLSWHGPCQADFIVDESGAAYLIDVNPRLWGSLAQAIAAGVDFPLLIYQLARDGDVAPVLSYRSGVVTRWLGGELAAFPGNLRLSPKPFRFLAEFTRSGSPAAMFDDFSFADPLPFLCWSLDALGRAVKSRSVTPVSHDSLAGVWE